MTTGGILAGLTCAIIAVSAAAAAGAAGAEGPRAVLNLPPGEGNPRNSEGDFVTLKDGRILFIYTHFTGGSGDGAAAHLASRVSSDGGLTWSDRDEPVPAFQGKENTMSVSLVRLGNGDVGLFYLVKNSRSDCRPYLQTSADDCKTWGEPRPLVAKEDYYVVNNARVIRTARGRLVVPAALHTGPGGNFVYRCKAICLLSDDDGKTWRASKSLLEAPPASKTGLQEPGAVELKGGRLMMLFRTDQKCQMRSYSDDGGDTWAEPEMTDIRSPVSPATLARIPRTGDLLLVWNDNGGDRGPQYAPGTRAPLSVAVSKDDGKTWSKPRDLEADANGWYCYTAVHFVGEDRVLMGYCAGTRARPLSNARVTAVPVGWVYGGE
jgi:Neuraminidase (sialidase)